MDLKIENTLLKRKIASLEKELHDLKTLQSNPFQLTFNQFKQNFLTNKFQSNRMPNVAGIYAYLKPSTNELYIGQSVDMRRRLKQHFKRGKVVVAGHDAQFTDSNDWEYYVLEYLPRNRKDLLDDREAYWIALAKVAVADKIVPNKKGLKQLQENLKTGKSVKDITVKKEIKGKGSLTNATRGNNVRM